MLVWDNLSTGRMANLRRCLGRHRVRTARAAGDLDRAVYLQRGFGEIQHRRRPDADTDDIDTAFGEAADQLVTQARRIIAEYGFGSWTNHAPRRTRKLLLHRSEIRKLIGKTVEKGLTLVPTRMYFKGKHAKVEIALARGKDLYDKRRTLKEKDMKREIQRELGAHRGR
mgnify:CR=1 FL=1